MSISRATFEERKVEINLYFSFVQKIIDGPARLSFPPPHGSPPGTPSSEESISIDLTHTLKANGFLLLYNLVEATMCNAIEDIHDAITLAPHLGTDDLINCLHNVAMKSFNKGSSEITEHLPHLASRAILIYWLEAYKRAVNNDKNPLFSGNIDARKIRDVAEDYGFSSATDTATTRNGAKLVTVKSKRNDLAHGHIAFKECGQEISIDSIVEVKNEVIAYLDGILANIEQYIEREDFRRPAASIAEAAPDQQQDSVDGEAAAISFQP